MGIQSKLCCSLCLVTLQERFLVHVLLLNVRLWGSVTCRNSTEPVYVEQAWVTILKIDMLSIIEWLFVWVHMAWIM